MTGAIHRSFRFAVVAVVAVWLNPLSVQARNTNTTIQEGRVNINRTIQIGESNDNATYQNGEININRTIQIDRGNRYPTGRIGRTGHRRASQGGGYQRAVLKQGGPERNKAKHHRPKSGKGDPGRRSKGGD